MHITHITRVGPTGENETPHKTTLIHEVLLNWNELNRTEYKFLSEKGNRD